MQATAPLPKESPLFCGAEKIARVLGVSDPTPLNWFKNGELKGVKLGNTVRFPIEETARKLGIDPQALM